MAFSTALAALAVGTGVSAATGSKSSPGELVGLGLVGSQQLDKLTNKPQGAPASTTSGATSTTPAPTPNAFSSIPGYALPYALSQFTQIPGSKVPGTLPTPPASTASTPATIRPNGGPFGGALTPLLNKNLR